MLQSTRWFLYGVVAAASATCSFACDVSGPRCAEDAPLARLGSEWITERDVREQVARVAVAGGRMTQRDALIDLLWQEAERRRLGLPGGTEAEKSRQRVVVSHVDRLRNGQVQPLRANPSAIPTAVRVTACGSQLLQSSK